MKLFRRLRVPSEEDVEPLIGTEIAEKARILAGAMRETKREINSIKKSLHNLGEYSSYESLSWLKNDLAGFQDVEKYIEKRARELSASSPHFNILYEAFEEDSGKPVRKVGNSASKKLAETVRYIGLPSGYAVAMALTYLSYGKINTDPMMHLPLVAISCFGLKLGFENLRAVYHLNREIERLK